MKSTLKKAGSALLGLSMLLATVAPPLAMAGSGNEGKTEDGNVEGVSNKEMELLLETYEIEELKISSYKTVKIYDENDNLVYAEKVSVTRLEDDARLLALIDKSDFLTEVNDVKFYKMDN